MSEWLDRFQDFQQANETTCDFLSKKLTSCLFIQGWIKGRVICNQSHFWEPTKYSLQKQVLKNNVFICLYVHASV